MLLMISSPLVSPATAFIQLLQCSDREAPEGELTFSVFGCECISTSRVLVILFYFTQSITLRILQCLKGSNC